VPYLRIYDFRSACATCLSAGGVADEWVTQLLRQGDAKVFRKYSQMKLRIIVSVRATTSILRAIPVLNWKSERRGIGKATSPASHAG